MPLRHRPARANESLHRGQTMCAVFLRGARCLERSFHEALHESSGCADTQQFPGNPPKRAAPILPHFFAVARGLLRSSPGLTFARREALLAAQVFRETA